MKKIVLCSSSPFRKALLDRLQLPYETVSPDVDETPFPDESAKQLVARLSLAKAKVHAKRFPDALLIGADQVVDIDGAIVGKPGSHEEAVALLMSFSERTITTQSGVCLFNSDTGEHQLAVEPYSVTFRRLTLSMVENYLRKDQPYNSAGALKADSLGIALIESMSGNDANALIGLPLVRLVRMLENEKVEVV